MKDPVKLFIENTASLIEDEDWGGFFKRLIYARIISAEDLVEDVLQVLDEADINYQYYFKKYDLLSKEDIVRVFSYFRNVYQPNNYSGGPDGADFITNFGSFPIKHTREDVDKIARIARDFGFKTYQTNNGGDGGYDYALISPRSTIEDFVDDILWEVDGIKIEDFKLVE